MANNGPASQQSNNPVQLTLDRDSNTVLAAGALAPVLTTTVNSNNQTVVASASQSVMDTSGLSDRTPSRYFNTNGFAFPRTRRALAKVLAGTGRMRAGFIGDSTTAGAGSGTSGTTNLVAAQPNAMPTRFGQRMATLLGASSSQAVTECFVTNAAGITVPTYDPRVTFGGGTVALGGANYMTVGGELIQIPSGGTLVINPGVNVDTCVIGYVANSGNGTITPSLDNAGAVSPASLNTAIGGLNVKTQTFTWTKGLRTLTLTGSVSNCYIQYIILYDSTSPGVDIFNLSRWGGVANDWTTASNIWSPANAGAQNAWASLGLDLAVIQLTINDANAATNLATYQNGIQAIITRLQALSTVPDILLMDGWPSNNVRSTDGTLTAVRGVLKSLASANGLPYISFGEGWIGSYSNYSDYYNGDGVHIGATGYADQADFLSRAILALR